MFHALTVPYFTVHTHPPFMMEIFEEKALLYQPRCLSNLNLPKVRTTYYGTDSKVRGPRNTGKITNRNKKFGLFESF